MHWLGVASSASREKAESYNPHACARACVYACAAGTRIQLRFQKTAPPHKSHILLPGLSRVLAHTAAAFHLEQPARPLVADTWHGPLASACRTCDASMSPEQPTRAGTQTYARCSPLSGAPRAGTGCGSTQRTLSATACAARTLGHACCSSGGVASGRASTAAACELPCPGDRVPGGSPDAASDIGAAAAAAPAVHLSRPGAGCSPTRRK